MSAIGLPKRLNGRYGALESPGERGELTHQKAKGLGIYEISIAYLTPAFLW